VSSGSPADLIRTILQTLGTSSQNGGYSGGAPLPRVIAGVGPSRGSVTPSTPVATAPPMAPQAAASLIQQALQGIAHAPIVPQFQRA
jgi:hypothetical protein